jgi:hypothetical protein
MSFYTELLNLSFKYFNSIKMTSYLHIIFYEINRLRKNLTNELLTLSYPIIIHSLYHHELECEKKIDSHVVNRGPT